MEPLSIVASAVTLSAAVSAGVSQLRALHSADRELQAIANEVWEIQVVYHALQESIELRQSQHHFPRDRVSALASVLENSKTSLIFLDTLIKDRLVRAYTADGEPKASRISWLKQRNRIKTLVEELRGTRYNICALWGASHSFDISCIQYQLEAFNGWQGKQNEILLHQSRRMDAIVEQITSQRLLEAPNNVQTQDDSVSSSSDSSRTLTGQSFQQAGEENLIVPRRLDDDWSPADKTHTYNTVRVRASKYRRSECEGWCSCSCHQINYYRTPKDIENTFGSVHVGLSGLSPYRQICSERSCRKQTIPTFKAAYYFPQWFLARMISFAVSLTYMNGPQMSLHMPRVIESNADLFTFAVQGDLSGMKRLFKAGRASPYDVAASNGRTALHYAVNYNHQEMSQFLIDAGADPSLEDKDRASTVSLAWGRMFGALVQRSTMDSWRCLFDDEDHLESRSFPPLHKIVLGLSPVTLKNQLELSTAGIDDPDADGRTALSWAATRGDLDAVSLLLQFKANPNVASQRGQTPLHWASQNPTADCWRVLELLIEAGSKVNAVDYWKRTALIYASCNQDDPQVLEVLLRGGADINFQDCHRRTSVGYAAKMGKFRGLDFLLSHGADETLTDAWGFPPMFEAVQHNHHSSLKVLIRHRPISLVKDVYESSIFHIVALYGDEKSMSALEQGNIGDLNLSALDKNGNSPQDLLNQREELTPELRNAFQKLTAAHIPELAKIFGLQIPNFEHERVGDDYDESEEFVDAQEHLDTVSLAD